MLDITAELVDRGLVDETGLLDDDYSDDGVKIADSPGGEPIVFTQQDIREIQSCKGGGPGRYRGAFTPLWRGL